MAFSSKDSCKGWHRASLRKEDEDEEEVKKEMSRWGKRKKTGRRK